MHFGKRFAYPFLHLQVHVKIKSIPKEKKNIFSPNFNTFTMSLGKPCKLTYKDWDAKIQANFEKNFWIAPDANKQINKLINKQGMYKDSVGATQFWADYQLRPNFPIAMVAVSITWFLISIINHHLINKQGMYKDSVGATQFWADYQLRPNFPIAMVAVSITWFLISIINYHLINKQGMYKDSVGATQFWADYQLRPNFPIAMVAVSITWFLISIINYHLINKQGMYKDSVGATQFWADYQLRPNFPIAMVAVSITWFLISIINYHLINKGCTKTALERHTILGRLPTQAQLSYRHGGCEYNMFFFFFFFFFVY